MYSLADYYKIEGLKELAKTKFRASTEKHWDSPELGQAVYIVFTSTLSKDRGLRQVVKEIFQKHPRIMGKPEIESVMRELPDLAYDLLMITRDLLVLLPVNAYCQSYNCHKSLTGCQLLAVCSCGRSTPVGTVPRSTI